MRIALLTISLAVCAAAIAGAQQSAILAPLDQAVNAVLSAAGASNRDATRVVPVVTAEGAVAGYAQIVGSQGRVAATRAVLNVSTSTPHGWSIETLVPVSTVSRDGRMMHRVYGVAVDALVREGP
jgi:hypothetical protein